MQITRKRGEQLGNGPTESRFSVTNDRVLTIEDKRYLVHFSENDSAFDIEQDTALVTVIDAPDHQSAEITETWLQKILSDYDLHDDVFRTEFLERVVFHGNVEITDGARDLLKSRGTEWIDFLSAEYKPRLRPGPYVIVDNHFREVWRLHKDNHEVFMLTLQPGLQKNFTELRITTASGEGYRDLAVPSRLRASRSHELIQRPLNGLRVAVKDNIHLKGVRTSLCNRAYYLTFGPQPETAVCIQKLIDAGSVILGKTKLSSFGHWEEPMEYIDYQAPWNPRADQYQSPGGSSSGSACSVAAYDWLDIAIGADTVGSIMRPALWAGVFGMRPTHGRVSNQGMVPSVSGLDTACFLGRDLKCCEKFAQVWYGDRLSGQVKKTFNRIIWPADYWVDIGPEQQTIARNFVQDLEKYLGIDHEMVSFKIEWDNAPPLEAGGASLQKYMQSATAHVWYDDFQNTAGFRDLYMRKNDKTPYVSPPVRKLWDEFSTITEAQRDEAWIRLKVFKRWFDEIFMSNDEGNPLFVIPIENLTPRYRDEPIENVEKPEAGINSLFLSPALGTPELIVPVGVVPFLSKTSNREEDLAFAVGLMSPKDTDLILMQMVYGCLSTSGRPTKVATGRNPFKKVETPEVPKGNGLASSLAANGI